MGDGYAKTAARAVVTTTLSAATGGVTVIILEKLCGDKSWNVGAVCNGILGGLVSITAGCSTLMPWAAVLAGLVGLLAAPDYSYASGNGLFYGGGQAIGCAFVTLFAEIAWVGIMSCIMFFPLKLLGILRVSAEIEAAGMDVSKHGGAAYEQ